MGAIQLTEKHALDSREHCHMEKHQRESGGFLIRITSVNETEIHHYEPQIK